MPGCGRLASRAAATVSDYRKRIGLKLDHGEQRKLLACAEQELSFSGGALHRGDRCLHAADIERDRAQTRCRRESQMKFRRLTRWHLLTITLLFLGYSGYYFCRSDYSVALPLIIAEQAHKGMPASLAQIRLGSIASLGVLAYAIGKFPSGGLADRFGGRRNFLGGMFGSILFTVLFMLGGGFPIFTLAWVGNRLVQSLGWAGMVKLTSRWFSYNHLRRRDGSAQSQLLIRRCGFASHYVSIAGPWFRLERTVWSRRLFAQRTFPQQSHLFARVS